MAGIILNGEPFQTFNFMPELEDDIFNSILTDNFGEFQDILLKSDRSEGGVLTESRSLGTTLIRMSKRIQEDRQKKATGIFPMTNYFLVVVQQTIVSLVNCIASC